MDEKPHNFDIRTHHLHSGIRDLPFQMAAKQIIPLSEADDLVRYRLGICNLNSLNGSCWVVETELQMIQLKSRF